jgi:hypothetical protein
VAIQADLFTTAAQVIPTMAIVIIVEQALYLPRVKGSPDASWNSLLLVSAALLLATVGEFFALRALTWTPAVYDVVAVWFCIGWLAFLLALPVFRELWVTAQQPTRDGVKRAVAIVMLVLTGLISVGAGLTVWAFR